MRNSKKKSKKTICKVPMVPIEGRTIGVNRDPVILSESLR
jgi:hypothetical protein